MNKRILLVEDDCALATLLRDNLEFEKFAVEWSETGRDAMQKAKAFSPDLVLLDLVLARGVDAFELCRQFSQGPERTPVIVLTARGERADKIRGQAVRVRGTAGENSRGPAAHPPAHGGAEAG
jgi:two-component system phosphate regulon response regulator PhoB